MWGRQTYARYLENTVENTFKYSRVCGERGIAYNPFLLWKVMLSLHQCSHKSSHASSEVELHAAGTEPRLGTIGSNIAKSYVMWVKHPP
jgi:hypothetical protein